MKKILFLLMIISGYSSYAQQDLGVDESAPRLVFNQADFGDKFAVLADDDQSYNYFVTDLTKLPTRFQKVYFLNSVYSDHQVISIDSDLSKDQLWFKVPATMTERDALCKFDDLKSEAVKAENSMTPEERLSWLAGHDKFQKVNN
jgi:hypothetical protein